MPGRLASSRSLIRNTRRGQSIAVGPVAIREVDPVVARYRVQISAPQPREKSACHSDRA